MTITEGKTRVTIKRQKTTTAKPAPPPAPKRQTQYCTFCGARDDEVRLLISCYAAMICDHCVQICNEILTENEIPLMAQVTEAPNA